MKISASIYSGKEVPLEELVRDLDNHHIDYFHIDCLDNHGVFDDIRAIRRVSRTPIDLHVITPDPEKFFGPIREEKIEMVSFQYETLQKKLQVPKDIAARVGLALVSETPIDIFEKYNGDFSFILLMTTTPGQSGGRFNRDTFRKIREIRSRFPGIRIHVDGGVNDEVAFILRNMGVYAAVTGSYLMNAYSIGAAMLNLKSDAVESHYLVKDFMMGPDEIPLLPSKNLNFIDVLRFIEDYKMGFTILVDENGGMEGIISNADVRQELIRSIADLNRIRPGDIINRSPVSVNENQSIGDMLELVKSKPFPILYLPVVDNNNRAVGAIKFNNLVKGEA